MKYKVVRPVWANNHLLGKVGKCVSIDFYGIKTIAIEQENNGVEFVSFWPQELEEYVEVPYIADYVI